jgi:hypothetical protein
MSQKPSRRKDERSEDTTVQVTITLARGVVRRLDEHAKEQRRTRSNAASLLLERALDAANTKQVG